MYYWMNLGNVFYAMGLNLERYSCTVVQVCMPIWNNEYTKQVILNHGKSGVGIWFKHVQLM